MIKLSDKKFYKLLVELVLYAFSFSHLYVSRETAEEIVELFLLDNKVE